MKVYVALLRAVNVGGTGKLPMSELKRFCEEAGFGDVKTYIQSGNVVFTAKDGEPRVKAALESALAAHLGREAGVFLRNAAEMRALVDANPFRDKPANRVTVVFLDHSPTSADMEKVAAPDDEEVKAGERAAFVHYPNGMGRSKLKIPFAAKGTARNMNTVAKLTEMAEQLERK